MTSLLAIAICGAIPWMDSYQDARERLDKRGVPFVAFLSIDGCEPCQRMHDTWGELKRRPWFDRFTWIELHNPPTAFASSLTGLTSVGYPQTVMYFRQRQTLKRVVRGGFLRPVEVEQLVTPAFDSLSMAAADERQGDLRRLLGRYDPAILAILAAHEVYIKTPSPAAYDALSRALDAAQEKLRGVQDGSSAIKRQSATAPVAPACCPGGQCQPQASALPTACPIAREWWHAYETVTLECGCPVTVYKPGAIACVESSDIGYPDLAAAMRETYRIAKSHAEKP